MAGLPLQLFEHLQLLIEYAAGHHETCPEGAKSWCRWKKAQATLNAPPSSKTNYKPLDIAKVQEEFSKFCSIEFCSHLTMGLTQNANESLHNTIWNLIPKSKYVSPQSIRISVNIAVLIFNEGEMILYQILKDLGLDPSPSMNTELAAREQKRKRNATRQVGANKQRRRRRQRLMKQHRERDLQKAEGGAQYERAAFGMETLVTPKKTLPRSPNKKANLVKESNAGGQSKICLVAKAKQTSIRTCAIFV